METSVLLVDDHPLFREGLRLLLEKESDLNIVGEAEDGQTAIDLARELVPDIIVMDIAMQDMDGIEATRRILSEEIDTKVMVLSIHRERRFIEDMLRAGAVGYVLKESALEELVDGIMTVTRGEVYLSEAVRDVLVTQFMNNISSAEDDGEQAELDGKTTSDPILVTKLHRPRIPSRVLPRPRLWEQFERGYRRPLTLVSAPAGYGKSTAVSQWLEGCEIDSAWLSLDEQDNDLRTFLTYLTASIQTLFPEAIPKTIALLKATILPPQRVLASTLVNELEQVPRRFALVIDDYQSIDESLIHQLMGEIIRHPPKNMHLVLVTRSDPLLDLLRLRTYRQIEEIRGDDLRFKLDETLAFLEKVVDAPVREAVAAALNERVEGWVAGLHLITLDLEDSSDLERISIKLPGEQLTLDYLVAEALSRQPREIQSWLFKTSILDRFCAPLSEAVGGKDDAPGSASMGGDTFLDWLRERNLFIIPLDNDGRWFRYHQLFRKLLQNQLENALDADDIAGLHSQASTWFASNYLVEEAIQHALAAGDVLAAAQIVEQNRLAALATDKWYVLKKWLDSLPHEIRQERPALLLAQAYISLWSTRVGEIPPIIERVEFLLDDDAPEPTLLAETSFFRSVISYFQGEGARSVEFLSKAIALLPQSSSGQRHLRGHFEQWMGMALHLSGRKETAIRGLNEAIRNQKSQEPVILSRLNFGLCFVHMLAGEWIQAWQNGLQFKEVSGSNGLIFSETWANYTLGNASFQMFELEKAHHYFRLVVENRYVSNHRAGIDAMAGLALTLQLMGEENEADEIMSLAQEFARWTPDPGNLEIVRSCQAGLALLRGDLDSAARWQQSLSETNQTPVMLFFLENPSITQCRVLIAMGTKANLEQAAEKLQQLRQVNEAAHNTCQMVEIIVLQAIAFHRQGHLDEALRVLEQVVAMTIPGAWVRPFVEAGQPMVDLLTLLQSQGGTKQSETLPNIAQILAAFPEETKPAADGGSSPIESGTISPAPTALESLTQRERQVLKLLATELFPQEIAVELDISVTTVRSHTKHIYGKLAVHGRLEAVKRAEALGLLN